MIRVRFAPSPTGYIHVGNARIALFNWFFSKKEKGYFILRYDDTDILRSNKKYSDAIYEDLLWLGIQPDLIKFQSERYNLYYRVIDQLKKSGFLYICYETLEELESYRNFCLLNGVPPVYSRRSLKMSSQEKKDLENQGRKPYWRFLLPNFSKNPFEKKTTNVYWKDIVHGNQKIDLSTISDPIVIRKNGTCLYTLSSVIDDIDMGITHIIRGDDHLTNTAIQIAIFKSLTTKIPIFGHINRFSTKSGEELSKRTNNESLSIKNLRNSGFESMSISSLCVLLGTSKNVEPCSNMKKLESICEISSVSKSSIKFDIEDLLKINKKILFKLKEEDVLDKLVFMGIPSDKVRNFWMIVRDNINTLKDVYEWWKIITDSEIIFSLDSDYENKEFLKNASYYIPSETFNDKKIWKNWINIIKKKFNKKGIFLFHPLRVALTGRKYGPPLEDLLSFMDRNLIIKRLQNFRS